MIKYVLISWLIVLLLGLFVDLSKLELKVTGGFFIFTVTFVIVGIFSLVKEVVK